MEKPNKLIKYETLTSFKQNINIIKLCLFVFALAIFHYVVTTRINNSRVSYATLGLTGEHFDEKDFDRFDNESGSGTYIVPNVVHFIRLGKARLDFVEVVCILAAAKNQRPDTIMIHTDIRPKGRYWNVVKKSVGVKLRLFKVTAPTEAFGHPFSKPWRVFHGSDLLRLKILRTYGGIYLDSDTYLVRNVDHFRRYELALGWSKGKPLQNQILIAHRDSRLLKLWLRGYEKDYRPTKWYYNAGDLPTAILEEQPHLAHHEPMLFGSYGVIRKIFERNWPEWRNYYSIHLMIRHQYLLKNVSKTATYPVKFNENNVHRYDVTFRNMVYDVYPYDRFVHKWSYN